MNKLLIAAAIVLSLGGCASVQNLETAWSMITSASVSPTQIIVAANAYDALEATATQYLGFCKTTQGAAQTPCSLSNRKKVVASVRAGRAARNALEPYVVSGTAGPSAVYNTLVAVIQSLQGASLPTQ